MLKAIGAYTLDFDRHRSAATGSAAFVLLATANDPVERTTHGQPLNALEAILHENLGWYGQRPYTNILQDQVEAVYDFVQRCIAEHGQGGAITAKEEALFVKALRSYQGWKTACVKFEEERLGCEDKSEFATKDWTDLVEAFLAPESLLYRVAYTPGVETNVVFDLAGNAVSLRDGGQAIRPGMRWSEAPLGVGTYWCARLSSAGELLRLEIRQVLYMDTQLDTVIVAISVDHRLTGAIIEDCRRQAEILETLLPDQIVQLIKTSTGAVTIG